MWPDGASEIIPANELARRFLNESWRVGGIRSSKDKNLEDCSNKSAVQKSVFFFKLQNQSISNILFY